MKKLIIFIILAFIIGFTVGAIANPSWLGTQEIYNRIFDSTTNTLKVNGV